jgi:hypothetical protein
MRGVAWALVRRTAARGAASSQRLTAARQYHVTRPILASLQDAPTLQRGSRKSRLTSNSSSSPAGSYVPNEEEVNTLFFDFLNNTSETFVHPQLSTSVSKIDAYLHLKSRAPALLANLEDESLNRLCMNAGIERLSGVVGSLLDDLEGKATQEDNFGGEDEDTDSMLQLSRDLLSSSSSSSSGKGGPFAALPGSQRRLTAVQSILVGASRKRSKSTASELPEDYELDRVNNTDHFLSAAALTRAFRILLEDFKLLSQGGSIQSGSLSPIPANLDLSTARRLARTIYMSKEPSLAPILLELIKHLSGSGKLEGQFPVAVEGCNLLDYFLGLDASTSTSLSDAATPGTSSDLPDTLKAANFIIDQMNKTDSDTVSNLVIDESSRQGKPYEDYLLEQGVNSRAASLISLQYTFRNIIILTLIKKRRFNILERQIEQTISELSSTAAQSKTKAPFWLLAKNLRLSIRLCLAYKHGRSKAYDLAIKHIDVWTQAKDSEVEENGALLRTLCVQAVQEGEPRLAAKIVQLMIDKRDSKAEATAPEAKIIGASPLIRLFNNQANHGRGDIVAQLLDGLGLVDKGGKIYNADIDSFVPLPLRAEFIATTAKAGLKKQSKALFERWACPLDSEITAKQVHAHVKDVMNRGIPHNEPSLSIRQLALGEDPAAQIRHSERCMTFLVKVFTDGHRKPFVPNLKQTHLRRNSNNDNNLDESRSDAAVGVEVDVEEQVPLHEDIQFAYHVLFQFYEGRERRNMERSEFVALATAYLSLDQRSCSFRCMGDIIKRQEEPKLGEAAFIMRLLSKINQDMAAALLIERVSYWTEKKLIQGWTQGENRLSELYIPLLSTCLYKGKIGLVKRLLASAAENGLQEEVGIRAVAGLLMLSQVDSDPALLTKEMDPLNQPRPGHHQKFSIATYVKILMQKENWKPDPSLLTWLIIRSTHDISLENFRTEGGKAKTNKHPGFSLQDSDRQAAILLLGLSARYLGFVNIRAADEVLQCIQNKAYHNGRQFQKYRRSSSSLEREVDEVAGILRWVPYINTSTKVSTFLQDHQDDAVTPKVPITEFSQEPTRLPVPMYNRLMTTYLRVGDVFGAASIMTWAREESKLTLEDFEEVWERRGTSFRRFIQDVSFATSRGKRYSENGTEYLKLFAGVTKLPRSKMWWQRPESLGGNTMKIDPMASLLNHYNEEGENVGQIAGQV